jgi:hypothetical protein
MSVIGSGPVAGREPVHKTSMFEFMVLQVDFSSRVLTLTFQLLDFPVSADSDAVNELWGTHFCPGCRGCIS